MAVAKYFFKIIKMFVSSISKPLQTCIKMHMYLL